MRFFLLACFVAVAFAQQTLQLPRGPVTRLASPDGSHVLYGVPYRSGVNTGPELWIEDTRTHQQQMLLAIGGTLSAEWSADGRAFLVQDNRASDSARTYLYDAGTLQRDDLAARILAADPSAQRFTEGHAYFRMERWDGKREVIVRFQGHTDRAPVVCFDRQYRVDLGAGVVKLSERESGVSQGGCQ